MSLQFSIRASLLLTAALAVSGALAAPVTYIGADDSANGRVRAAQPAAVKHSAFLGALATSAVETFGPRPAIPVGPIPVISYSVFGGLGTLAPVDIAAPGKSQIQDTSIVGLSFPGRFDTTGNTGVQGETGRWFQGSRDFMVTFSAAQKVFGTYITDLGDFGGGFFLDFMSGTSLVDTVDVGAGIGTHVGQGALAFVGYTNDSSSFDKVVFRITQADPGDPSTFDVIGFDDLTVGTLIPEPASIALVVLSLGLMGSSARRRKVA